MTLLRRLVILGLFLIAAPHAWAQIGAPIVLDNNSTSHTTLSVYGLTFSISGCTINGVACASNDNLVLEGVQTGRGNITIEVANKTAGSAALTQTMGGTTTLFFDLTVTSGGVAVSSASLQDTGQMTYSCSQGHSGCSAAVSASVAPVSGATFVSNPLTAVLANQAGAQTGAAVSTSLTATANPAEISETITLSSNSSSGSYISGGTLKLNTVALTLKSVPEPASLTVLMLGLGGLAMVRRRRRAL
jgi:hypothetical protein